MQKNTNIMQQQKQVEMMRKRVCYLLNWTVEEYNKYQRKQGCLYLQLKMSGSPQIIDELVESEMFWAWWKNEWAHREYVYVNSADILYLPNRLKLYYHYNDAEILVKDIHPCKVVMEETYKKMIGQVIKNSVL